MLLVEENKIVFSFWLTSQYVLWCFKYTRDKNISNNYTETVMIDNVKTKTDDVQRTVNILVWNSFKIKCATAVQLKH